MTWDEFRGDWLPAHSAAFTGIRAWLAKTTKGDGAPTEAAILRGWYGILLEVDLNAAKAASQRMHAGDLDEPKGFDRHPSAIRKACGVDRKQSSVQHFDADGNQTYACPHCRDDGDVICWHPISMKAAREGTLGNLNTIYSVGVVCCCAAGNYRRGKGWPRFDPKQWLPLIDNCGDRDIERLESFVAKMKPANYDAELAEFA